MDKELFFAFNKVAELNEAKEHEQVCLPLSIVVTLSQSSQGRCVHAINETIETFLVRLQQHPLLSSNVELSLLSSQEYVTVLRPLKAVKQGITVPMFSAKGHQRALGQGVEVAINMLRSRVVENDRVGSPCRRPWLVVITDGQGTDVWQDTAARLKRWSEDKAIIPIMINVGAPESSLDAYSVIPSFQGAETSLAEVLLWIEQSLTLIVNAQPGQVVHLPEPPLIETAGV